jgi:hypothetical protein
VIEEVREWRGLAQLLPGGVVIVGPEVAAFVVAQIDAMERRGEPRVIPRHLERLRDVCTEAVAQAGNGRADVRTDPVVPASSHWLTTREAAHMLDVTERHATRLAATNLMRTRKRRGQWQFLAADVVLLQLERSAAS